MHLIANGRAMKIMSFNWVRKHILSKERIHHCKADSMCPICEKYEKLVKKATKENNQFDPILLTAEEKKEYYLSLSHKINYPIQRQQYKKQKDSVINNIDGQEILIVLDFSQLKVQGKFRQDLIVCIYRHYDQGIRQSPKILKTYHYVSPSNTSADIHFVIGSLSHLVEHHKIFDGIKKVFIWTDGCTRQFKLTTNLLLWVFFRSLIPNDNVEFIYNFFASYHGFNVCDAAASNTKNKLNIQQRDTGVAFRNEQQISDSLNTLKNTVSQKCVLIPEKPEPIKKILGIKTYHKMVIGKKDMSIYVNSHPSCNLSLKFEYRKDDMKSIQKSICDNPSLKNLYEQKIKNRDDLEQIKEEIEYNSFVNKNIDRKKEKEDINNKFLSSLPDNISIHLQLHGKSIINILSHFTEPKHTNNNNINIDRLTINCKKIDNESDFSLLKKLNINNLRFQGPLLWLDFIGGYNYNFEYPLLHGIELDYF